MTPTLPPVAPPAETAGPELDALIRAAAAAAPVWAHTARPERAAALTAVAAALEAAAETLIDLAATETHLPYGRLRGELSRTTFQLGLFAEVIADGAYLGVRIDHADADWPMGAPRPDLRRRLEPIGPVVVFAASNFPFAFSVAGGDTASALAAGCPVLLKAHPGHPLLSAATGRVVTEALASAGAAAGTFAVFFGDEAGRTAVTDPRIQAGAFTGSLAGGRALFDLAAGRPQPIPFYGELGSLNPVLVTRSAAADRAAAIADGFVASFTLGAGQFCTKPGLLVVPADSALPELLAAPDLPPASPLLNAKVAAGHRAGRAALLEHTDVSELAAAPTSEAPAVLLTSLDAVLDDPEALLAECFGPTALVATYTDEAQLLDLADALEGQLTATLVADEGDAIVPDLVRRLARRAGRLLWNEWPTGVSVTYAQQHGGPYPATTAPATTSVGTAAIERFLRPVAYQGFPSSLLPDELRDADPDGAGA